MTDHPQQLHISTPVRGRVLLCAPQTLDQQSTPQHVPQLILGFHGYGQNAQTMLDHLQQLAASKTSLLCSVQALHPFYARHHRPDDSGVGASWMTKQDRLLAIEDNLTYLNNVLAELAEHYTWDRLILVGFSQGVAIAWRLLAHSLTNPNPRLTVHALVGLGGDIPPDVAESGALNNLGAMPILLGRGHKDRLYDREKFNADLAICEAANIEYRSIEFEGAHDWASGFTHAVNVVLGAMD